MCTCPINFGFEKKNPLLFVELNILLLFRGYLCEYNLQEFYSCKFKPCQNLGYCTPQGTCVCPSIASGKFCETLIPTTTVVSTTTVIQVDFCRTTSCQNGGTCISINSNTGFCNCMRFLIEIKEIIKIYNLIFLSFKVHWDFLVSTVSIIFQLLLRPRVQL